MRELNLAHKIMNDTEEAYCRTDFMQDRREVNDAWSAHCLSLSDSSFVPPVPYVRPDQPAIDEAWRLWFAGEANSRLHAAKLAVGDKHRTPAVGSVYNNMQAQPRKGTAPPSKQASWGSSRTYVAEAVELLRTKQAGNPTQAAKMVADRSNGAVNWEAIARRLVVNHPDVIAQASGIVRLHVSIAAKSSQLNEPARNTARPLTVKPRFTNASAPVNSWQRRTSKGGS